MDEIIKRDQNFVTVLAGVTDDAAQNIRMIKVDPATGRVLISGPGGGGGDVSGPGSSTDNAIVRFDGTTGKLIQNSTVILSDSGVATGFTIGTGNAIGGVIMNLGSDSLGDSYYRGAAGILTRIPIGTSGQVWTVSGGIPSWQNAAAGSGYNLIQNNGVSVTQETTINLSTLLTASDVGGKTALTINVANLATDPTFLSNLNLSTIAGQINLTTQVSGTLPVANGGSGAATLTGVLVGHGTGAFTGTAIAQGDVFYGSATGTLAALGKNTSATRYLSNTGTSNNPAWAQVDLTNGVTGLLPAANIDITNLESTLNLANIAGQIDLTTQVSGQLPLSNGGTGANLTDPGANTLLGWDDTDNSVEFFTIGSGLSYDHTSHTLSAPGTGAGAALAYIYNATITGGNGDSVLDVQYDENNNNYYVLVNNFVAGPTNTLTVYLVAKDPTSGLWYINTSRVAFNIFGSINFACMAIDSTNVYVLCNHFSGVANDLATMPLNLGSSSSAPIVVGTNTLNESVLFSDGTSLWFFASDGTQHLIQYDIIGATFNAFTLSGFSAGTVRNLFVDIGNTAAYAIMAGQIGVSTFTVTGGVITQAANYSLSIAGGPLGFVGTIYSIATGVLNCAFAYGDGYLYFNGFNQESKIAYSVTNVVLDKA